MEGLIEEVGKITDLTHNHDNISLTLAALLLNSIIVLRKRLCEIPMTETRVRLETILYISEIRVMKNNNELLRYVKN